MTKASVGKYVLLTSAEISTAATPVYTASFSAGIADQYLYVEAEKTVAFSDVAATVVLQGSFDGTSWFDLVTVSSDLVHSVGKVVNYVDMRGKFAPNYRLAFNTGSLAAGTAGRITFRIGHKNQF
jgi:hypothetical protein